LQRVTWPTPFQYRRPEPTLAKPLTDARIAKSFPASTVHDTFQNDRLRRSSVDWSNIRLFPFRAIQLDGCAEFKVVHPVIGPPGHFGAIAKPALGAPTDFGAIAKRALGAPKSVGAIALTI